ncbi:hypothetical protein FBUS_11150 [Fasciolopsis buskii]|uniref:KATNIP domain-containing protein n=1 Tax=Fasciolopsis buskii TaxID=27845 RepID=A0A8E0VLI9_9TREM|nr:hypothetical protein FBUS_11150 [Fasciolopsis buski]
MQQAVKVVSEQINRDYQDYLFFLEEKNRQRAQLRRKSREARRREKLEKGFNLFFNLPSPAVSRRRAKSRDACQTDLWTDESTHASEEEFGKNSIRTRSAPGIKQSGGPRRVWGPVAIPRDVTGKKLTRDISNDRNCDNLTDSKTVKYVSSKNNQPCTTDNGNNTGDQILDVENAVNVAKPDYAHLRVHIDVLSNWGDPKLVGFKEVYLIPEDGKNQKCKISSLKMFSLDSNRTGTNDRTQAESFPEDQNALSKLLSCRPWTVDVSNIPFRIQLDFDCLAPNDRLFFRLVNLNSEQNYTCSPSLNHICLRFTFAPESTKSIDTNMRPTEMLEIQIDLSGKEIQLWETQNENQNTCSPSWLNCDSIEEKANKSTVLLDLVSPELLSMPTDCLQKRRTNKGRRRADSILECSWSSLDFFNHFHEGRLSGNPVNLQTLNGDARDIKMQSVVSSDCAVECDESDKPEVSYKKDHNSKFVLPPRPSTLDIPVPELPHGSRLIFDIVNTWGDVYYVGLSGLEIFMADGNDVAPLCEIRADPSDINILPGYGSDPRVVSNLVDGVNWTRDDTHMWLAPFNPGERHLIFLELPEQTSQIAMIRIWNYNKSRVHTFRGVKELIMYLDDRVIFYGEIKRALGLESQDPMDFCETILFTTNDDILELVAKNDRLLQLCRFKQDTGAHLESIQENDEKLMSETRNESGSAESCNAETERHCTHTKKVHLEVIKTNEKFGSIDIELSKPWNPHQNRIGLTGIKLFDTEDTEIPIEQISPMGCFQSESGPLDVLLNGCNETTDLLQMWSCIFDQNSPPCIRLFYQSDRTASKLQLWNHNGSTNQTNYGVERIRILSECCKSLAASALDNHFILIRRAPGHTKYSLIQNISLDKSTCNSTENLKLIEQPASVSFLPRGFVYRIDILSTWFDRYYVGLDGLELLDIDTRPIKIQPGSIFAFPSCVNDAARGLAAKQADIRTVDKLVDGVTSGSRMSSHCWLAPFDVNQGNQIYIVFDQPVVACGLRLWNYSRTVERGVREFVVFVDDKVIFHGYLPKATPIDRQPNDCTSKNYAGIKKETVLPMDKDRWSDANRCQPHVVVFDDRYARRFPEHPEYIVRCEALHHHHSSDDITELSKISHIQSGCHKPKLFSRTQRDPVNHELRPFTCVAHCRQ